MTKWALLPDSIQILPDRVTQSLNLVILYGPPYRLYKSWNRPCRTFSSRGTPRWAWPGSPPAADRAPGSPRSWRQSNLTLICKNVFQKRFSLRLTKLVKRFFLPRCQIVVHVEAVIRCTVGRGRGRSLLRTAEVVHGGTRSVIGGWRSAHRRYSVKDRPGAKEFLNFEVFNLSNLPI